METKKQKLRDSAHFLRGAASVMCATGNAGELSTALDAAAYNLLEASNSMCSQGFFGCYDRDNGPCTSDHK